VAYKRTETVCSTYNGDLLYSVIQEDYRYVANTNRSVTIVDWFVVSYS
jgi:hypothetical protein